MKNRTVPHAIPYQGSKRNLAQDILRYFPRAFHVLYEPFAGSAAITIAAAVNQLGDRYHINDLNEPLVELWRAIIETPDLIVSQYEALWISQLDDPRSFYDKVRLDFNRTGRPELFLYLLARCVKGSVRYNSHGEFNQSPDNRRLGMRPETMRLQICSISHALKGKTAISSVDYQEVLRSTTADDLVYMDPPYQGVCGNRDTRYLQSVSFSKFVEALVELNARSIRYIVSYDGRTGDKTHGKSLPEELNLTLIELFAGRSTQATLIGREDVTIESLYLSPSLVEELVHLPMVYRYTRGEQLCLMERQGEKETSAP